MSTPANQQNTLLPSEIFFLAEDTPVSVIPHQSLEELDLIGVSTPKLRVMREVLLPMWIALLLKSQGRVKIKPPEWLNEERLKAIYDKESNEFTKANFTELPWHWMEIGQALLDGAPDDLTNPSHVIRNLLRDIREIRQAKARNRLNQLNEANLDFNNAGAMEINEIRPYVGQVMDRLRRFNDLVQDEIDDDDDDDDDDDGL